LFCSISGVKSFLGVCNLDLIINGFGVVGPFSV